MRYALEVFDPPNVASQGDLAKPWGIAFAEDLRGPAPLVFSLDLDNSADRALLPEGVPRVIRIRRGAAYDEAYVARDQPAELVAPDGKPFLRYQCDQLISKLGYDRGGALLFPYGGIGGLEQSPRWFGPMGWDFIERTGIPEPTTGGPLTRENWPDPRAERFVFPDRAVYRRILTGSSTWADHPSRMWFTCSAWTAVRVWLDGAEIESLSSDVGDRTIHTFDIVYDGEDHVICFDCEGSPPAGADNSLGWTWGIITADANGEYNHWNIENRLFTTFSSVTYTGPTAPTPPLWQAWESYADGDYPGVTNGFVSQTAVLEAQARGALAGVTLGYDELVDADGVGWANEFTHAFALQRLGPLHDQLAAWGCEPYMTPTSELRLYQQRGDDRTATVIIATPEALSATGQGPKATRYLLEAESGFGQVINEAAEAAMGEVLEDIVTLGHDVHPHTGAAAVEAQLAIDAAVHNGLRVKLPSSILPHVDVFMGDIVTTIASSSLALAPARIVNLSCEINDANGDDEWYAILEPV